MAKLSNLEMAYEFISSKKDAYSFKEIWQHVENNSLNNGKDLVSIKADLYADLVTDGRFLMTPDNLWALSSSKKFNDVKKRFELFEEKKPTKKSSDSDEELDIDEELESNDDFDDFGDEE